MCDKKGRWKLGEMMQKQVEKVTDVRPSGCSWWSLQKDPLVAEVLTIFNLAESYPHMFNEKLPSAIYQGVLVYKSARRRAQNHWLDPDNKKIEDKQRAEKLKGRSKPPRRTR